MQATDYIRHFQPPYSCHTLQLIVQHVPRIVAALKFIVGLLPSLRCAAFCAILKGFNEHLLWLHCRLPLSLSLSTSLAIECCLLYLLIIYQASPRSGFGSIKINILDMLSILCSSINQRICECQFECQWVPKSECIHSHNGAVNA